MNTILSKFDPNGALENGDICRLYVKSPIVASLEHGEELNRT